MDDTPNATLALVSLEDLLNVGLEGEVALEHLNLEGLLVLLGSISRELSLSNLGDPLQSLGERVVEAGGGWKRFSEGARRASEEGCSLVDGDYAVLSREQAAKCDVRSYRTVRVGEPRLEALVRSREALSPM